MTIVHETGLAVATPPSPGELRRRRVVVVLATACAASSVWVISTPSAPALAALALSLCLAAVYGGLVHRSGRLEMERGLLELLDRSSSRRSDAAWYGIDASDLATGMDSAQPTTPRSGHPERLSEVSPGWRQALAFGRFAVCYAAGWALSPVTFALTLAVGRTPRDSTGQRWLANLQSTQTQLKDQSMRTLVVSAAATASVTGVGGAVVLSGSGVATAATGPMLTGVSVGMPASVGVGVAASAGTTYRVVSGDTLSSIAARFGTTYQALAAANHVSDPNLIFPGQVLAVPSGHESVTTSATHPAAPSTYRVQAGDTLSGIASRFGTTYQALAQINGIANPNVIVVGEVLRLSGSASAPTTTARTVSPPASTTQPVTAPITASTGAATAVRVALAQVGKPYVWAGAGPNSFDCSGLVMYAWAAAGVHLDHYTVSQYEETTRISQSQLQPGDLVFYDTGSGAEPGHVTMYIGNGQIVTADSPGTDIRVEVLDWDGTPMGFGRVR